MIAVCVPWHCLRPVAGVPYISVDLRVRLCFGLEAMSEKSEVSRVRLDAEGDKELIDAGPRLVVFSL